MKRIFPVLALSMFSCMLGVGIIVPLLPLYAESMGATGIGLGIIFAGFPIANAIVTPFAGRFSDRKGRKPFICTGLFLYSLISLSYVLANTAVDLTIIRFLQGIAGAMVMPIIQAYIGDVAPKGEEGKWMGYFNAAFFTGLGIGPLMGGTLGEHFGMDTAFYTMAGLNLIAFLGVTLFLPKSTRRENKTVPHSSYKELAASNMMRGLFTFRFSLATSRAIFNTFLPILAGIYLGLSPSLIGILLAVNVLGMSLLQAPGGRIADRFNRRTLVIIGGLINLAVMALIPSTGNFWQLFALCTFLGIATATAMPPASALTIVEGRKFGMGSAMAMFTLATSIGMAIGPILAGVIADYININSVFYFAAAVILVGAGSFSWFTR